MNNRKVKIEGINLIKKNQKILTDVTFEFTSGNSYLLLGRNGAGKSSLMNCILGLEANFNGDISYNGFQKFQPKLSFLPEMLEISEEICVKGYLNSFINLLKKEGRFDQNTFEEISKEFEIKTFKNKSFKELSKGMKKQTFISLVMSANSELLILDEPFEGLDLVSKEYLIERISKKKKDGTIVIVSSHELAMIYDKFDQIICLKKGMVSNVFDKNSDNYNKILESV